jgi:hypothetical protein
MTNLSDLVMRNPESKSISETLHQAELWSKKAFDIAVQHSSALNITNVVQNPECDVVLAFAAYNIGILRKVRIRNLSWRPMSNAFCVLVQMMGDKENARSYFEQSLKVSNMIGMQAGIQNAEDALRKVDEDKEQM